MRNACVKTLPSTCFCQVRNQVSPTKSVTIQMKQLFVPSWNVHYVVLFEKGRRIHNYLLETLEGEKNVFRIFYDKLPKLAVIFLKKGNSVCFLCNYFIIKLHLVNKIAFIQI